MNKGSGLSSPHEKQKALSTLITAKPSNSSTKLPKMPFSLSNVLPKSTRSKSLALNPYSKLNLSLLSPVAVDSSQLYTPGRKPLRGAFDRSHDLSPTNMNHYLNPDSFNPKPASTLAYLSQNEDKEISPIKYGSGVDEQASQFSYNLSAKKINSIRLKPNKSNDYVIPLNPLKFEHNDILHNFSIPQANKEVVVLREKIQALKESNRKLLDEKDASFHFKRDDLQSVYNQYYLNEIQGLQQKVNELTTLVDSQKQKIDALDKENQSLKNSLDVYRSLAVEQHKHERHATRHDGEDEEEDEMNFENGIIDKFAALIRSLHSTKNTTNFLKKLVQESTHIFECGYARLILVDQKLQKLCQDSGLVNAEFALGKTYYPVVKHQESKRMDERLLQTAVDSPEAMRKFAVTEQKLISSPIFSIRDKRDDIYCVLQITDPLFSHAESSKKLKKRRLFSFRDEKTAIFLSKVLALALDLYFLNEKLHEQKAKYQHFSDSMSELGTNKNLQEFLFTIKEKGPKLLGFDHIGVLFQKESEEIFYTYDMQKTPEGKFVSRYPVKFPLKTGISNYIYQHGIELVSANDPRQQKLFTPEIDNVSGAPAVKNMIITLLRDDDGHRVGVLQAINKSDGKQIQEADEVAVKSLMKLFASMISHINRVEETLNVTYALKTRMQKMALELKIRNDS